MEKVCIFIPTYNRPDCMREWLQSLTIYEDLNNIEFYISDTSDNSETEEIVNIYSKKINATVGYEHIKEYPDKTTDLKVARGFLNLKNNYDYVYLCGDGLIVDIDKLKKIFAQYRSDDFDVIHFYKELDGNAKIFFNGRDFAYICGWYVTYYGATILSSRLLNKLNYEFLLNNFRNTGFLVWEGIFSAIGSDNEKIAVLKDFPARDNPYKKVNSSYQPKRFMEFWVASWSKVVDALPVYYDDIKDHLRKDIGRHLKLYNFNNLVRLRHSQNLDINIYTEYKSQIPMVTDMKQSYIYLMSVAPISVLDIMLGIKKRLAKIYHRLIPM